jgi:hypothetical protein
LPIQKFEGSDTSYEWDDATSKGIAHAEGMFSSEAEIESGETIYLEGPFKLYMSNDDGWWRIFLYYFPRVSIVKWQYPACKMYFPALVQHYFHILLRSIINKVILRLNCSYET